MAKGIAAAWFRDPTLVLLIIGPIVLGVWFVHAHFGHVRGMHWLLITATAFCTLRYGQTAGLWAAALATAAFSLVLSPLNGAPPTIATAFLAGGASVAVVLVIEAARSQGKQVPSVPRAAIGWLPFIQDTKAGRTFWAVRETGDYTADCEAGAALAAELIADIRRQGRPELLGWVVANMVEKGKMTGVEVGFMAEIGRSLADHNPNNPAIQTRVVNGHYNGNAGPIHE